MELPTADDPARVIVADVLDGLRSLPDACVSCCVTSPPYWGLRDYGTGTWEGGDAGCDHKPKAASRSTRPKGKLVGSVDTVDAGTVQRNCHCGAVRIDRQIGLEATPEAFVARLVEVFEEVRRVLHPSGTCWVNMGDSYASGGTGGWRANSANGSTLQGGKDTQRATNRNGAPVAPGLKPKDLCGVPWRLAFALQSAGWYLRSDIIWHKPSPMPESVTDRPTKSHEYVFLLTKRATYFYDAEAVKEIAAESGFARQRMNGQANWSKGTQDESGRGSFGPVTGNEGNNKVWPDNGSRNKRTVWTIASDPYPEAHFATFPPALVEPMVKAGSSEKGVCPACYAPWVRVTEKKRGDNEANGRPKRTAGMDSKTSTLSLSGNGSKEWAERGSKTLMLGWQPSCTCTPADPLPSIVLDPFAGSGTTLAVAVKLKRRAIGIELNPEYAKLAERRLAEPLGTGGLFDTGAPVVATLFDHLEP